MRKRILLLVTLLLTLLVILHQHYQESGSSSFYPAKTVNFVYRPFQNLAYVTSRFVKNTWKHYIDLVDAKKENEVLKKQINQKQLVVVTLEERIQSMLKVSKAQSYAEDLKLSGVPAHILAYDPFAQIQSVWVSKGSENGVMLNSPVINERGLVGRVIRVLEDSSLVLLMVDSHFSVDVINTESRVRALVVGSGVDAIRLKRYPLISHIEYFDLGQPFKRGDLLVTSGLGGIYPAGIPVGTVADIRRAEDSSVDRSTVIPEVDFSTLEEVVILQ